MTRYGFSCTLNAVRALYVLQTTLSDGFESHSPGQRKSHFLACQISANHGAANVHAVGIPKTANTSPSGLRAACDLYMCVLDMLSANWFYLFSTLPLKSPYLTPIKSS